MTRPVTILGRSVQTDCFSGRPGETVHVPAAIAAEWIALGRAIEAEGPPPPTPPKPKKAKP